jgi:hypothetical protein
MKKISDQPRMTRNTEPSSPERRTHCHGNGSRCYVGEFRWNGSHDGGGLVGDIGRSVGCFRCW